MIKSRPTPGKIQVEYQSIRKKVDRRACDLETTGSLGICDRFLGGTVQLLMAPKVRDMRSSAKRAIGMPRALLAGFPNC